MQSDKLRHQMRDRVLERWRPGEIERARQGPRVNLVGQRDVDAVARIGTQDQRLDRSAWFKQVAIKVVIAHVHDAHQRTEPVITRTAIVVDQLTLRRIAGTWGDAGECFLRRHRGDVKAAVRCIRRTGCVGDVGCWSNRIIW